MPLIILLFGSPGSGKGTQAEFLEKQFGFVKVSTGDVLRKHIKNETPIGLRVKEIMKRGDLVDDDTLLAIIKEEIDLESPPGRYVLDGYPRNLGQVSDFSSEFSDEQVRALWVDVPDEVVTRRLAGRLTCPNCQTTFHSTSKPPKVQGVCDLCGTALVVRPDDTMESVVHRLKVYQESTVPVLRHYREKGKLIQVDGSKPVKDVSSDIERILKMWMIEG